MAVAKQGTKAPAESLWLENVVFVCLVHAIALYTICCVRPTRETYWLALACHLGATFGYAYSVNFTVSKRMDLYFNLPLPCIPIQHHSRLPPPFLPSLLQCPYSSTPFLRFSRRSCFPGLHQMVGLATPSPSSVHR